MAIKRKVFKIEDIGSSLFSYVKNDAKASSTMEYAVKSICEEKANADKEYERFIDEGVSVCISAWNTKDYIEECLDSVSAQTWFSTHENWEILLGIDGCYDTLEKVREIMHKYKNLNVYMMDSNRGTYVTCNTIMSKAKYGWLLRFDSDDIMHKNMIEVIMNQKNNSDFILWKMHNFGNGNDSVTNTYGQHMIKTSLFKRINGYKAWICGADSDIINRCSKIAKYIRIDSSLTERRIHRSSLTMKRDTNFKSEIRAKYIKFVSDPNNYDSESKCINEKIETCECKKITNDRIIISFTSWKKRISGCADTVKMMMNQTILPYRIILNLSSDEFPGMENDLPCELVELKSQLFEIHWVKENTKVYKKIIPTMERFPDDVIVSIDDDIYYPEKFIESLYDKFCEYGKCFPMTCGTYKWGKDEYTSGKEIYSHAGGYCMVKKDFFGKYLDDIYTNVVLKKGIDAIPFDDLVMTYAALLNGITYKNIERIKGITMLDLESPVSDFKSSDYKRRMKYVHSEIQDYIKKKYKKDYNDLTKDNTIVSFSTSHKSLKKQSVDNVIVSLTSYSKRLPYVHKVINSILRNNVIPSKICLTLYMEDVKYMSEELSHMVNDGKVELIVCDEDIRPHKKYFYTMRKYRDVPIITIDDDVIYPENLIESLMESYKKHPDCISARRVHKIAYKENGEIDLCKNFEIECKSVTEPSLKITASGVGGVLYPPDILKVNDSWISNIRKHVSVDDKVLYYYELLNDIKIVYVPNSMNHPKPIKEIADTDMSINENESGDITKNDACIIDLVNNGIIKKKNIRNSIEKKAKSRGYSNFNIDNPSTWCEKIQWLQLYDDKNALKTICADKINLHGYSIHKLGKDICVPMLYVYGSPESITIETLPEKFILKCNHGYANNIIVRNKDNFDLNSAKSKLKEWLSKPFGVESIEPHYVGIERKCYSETLLEEPGKSEITDYKFLCFNGNPKYVQIINGRHTHDFHLNYYDMDFNFIEISRMDIPCDASKLDPKPLGFEVMKSYARKLSEDFRFVRVDFYEVGGTVYLGELTFTPATGFIRWTNPEIDLRFGKMITL